MITVALNLEGEWEMRMEKEIADQNNKITTVKSLIENMEIIYDVEKRRLRRLLCQKLDLENDVC